jgi:hypothetical protein
VRGSRAGIAGLIVAAVLAGCGSSSDGRGGLTDIEARALVAQLEAARASAAARDVAGTRAAVDKFRGAVAHLRRTGALSDATARSLRVGAARLLQRVRSDSAPPQPAPSSQPTPAAPAPLPPGQTKKHKERKDKHGKGKGHDKGEEGDE